MVKLLQALEMSVPISLINTVRRKTRKIFYCFLFSIDIYVFCFEMKKSNSNSRRRFMFESDNFSCMLCRLIKE